MENRVDWSLSVAVMPHCAPGRRPHIRQEGSKMLKLAAQMDEDARVKCILAKWVAVDENCGTITSESKPAHLTKSRGRRKAGRPTKYWLYGTGQIYVPEITAYTDEEAVELANFYFGVEPPEQGMGYICKKCGKPITAAEGDDNGGKCAEHGEEV